MSADYEDRSITLPCPWGYGEHTVGFRFKRAEAGNPTDEDLDIQLTNMFERMHDRVCKHQQEQAARAN